MTAPFWPAHTVDLKKLHGNEWYKSLLLPEAEAWCRENIGKCSLHSYGQWWTWPPIIYFKKPRDKVAFLLRWG